MLHAGIALKKTLEQLLKHVDVLNGPERLVYIDDRVELYGDARFSEYLAAREGDYRKVFDRYGMRAALVRSEWPLRMELLRDGWRITYEDDTFAVLVPDGR